ncbi:response regulator [Novosphingobium sp. G106]|uniref:response regulator n=1 Tax=Novosphingobium sp. G106 TaxID=2849500 RepID=UPI001C2DD6DA|nr:response regulator [Novosphingobium sp. G106]MBV1688665.1 response regulator [Novosphingobium sp. G106]
MATDTQRVLAGLHVLVVEDEQLIAMALAEDIEAAGAYVIGPAGQVARALDLIDIRWPDAAVLDIGLGSESCFPVADALLARNTPFVFTSGYEAKLIPPAYSKVPVIAKPADPAAIIAVLAAECRVRKRRR